MTDRPIGFTAAAVFTLHAMRDGVFSLHVATSEPRDPMIIPLESMYCVPPTCAFTRVSPDSLTQKLR